MKAHRDEKEREKDILVEKKKPEILYDDSDQLSLVPLESFAFDEMNIIETPFALLTNTSNKGSIDLSEEGHESLNSAKGKLPTALAETTVLGLMWLSMRQNNFKSPVIQFSLRDLVCNYVFEGRYKGTYTPSQKILKAVEQQIRAVAHTRITTDRWYDKKLGRRTPMDAAIIDSIQVIDRGGKNKPRLLKLRWGAEFFRSITSQYTKPIDPAIFRQIENPLDRRLYRWLDRQLAKKNRQPVRSCQNFARYKILMTGQKIEAGGRTASSYIAKKLKDAVNRLDDIGFAVRMVVDSSNDDFSLLFIRLPKDGPNEVVEEDLPGDMVREFQFYAHGVQRNTRKRRLPQADRMFAQIWLDAYGFEKANWMIKKCVEIQKASNGQRILTFRGLERYEQAASGEYEKHFLEREGQMKLGLEKERLARWDAYEEAMEAQAEETLTLKEKDILEKSAELRTKDYKDGFGRRRLYEIELKKLKLEKVNALMRDEFMEFKTDELLEKVLAERHGSSPLGHQNRA